MASSNLRRWPSEATPSSFRSSAVRFGRTVSSMSLSRKTASYSSKAKAPQPNSDFHEAAPQSRVAADHPLWRNKCLGGSAQSISKKFLEPLWRQGRVARRILDSNVTVGSKIGIGQLTRGNNETSVPDAYLQVCGAVYRIVLSWSRKCGELILPS